MSSPIDSRRFSTGTQGQGTTARDAVQALWRGLNMPDDAVDSLTLTGAEPVFPSSFAVGTAAQASMAAAALAAAEIWRRRGGDRQRVSIDMLHAAQECRSYFTLDGVEQDIRDKLTGLYRCADGGWLRIHANFTHHRDGALALLGLPVGPQTGRDAVEQVLAQRSALDVEQQAAEAGLPVAAMRSFDEWDRHPQGIAIAGQPVLTVTRMGDADPRPLPVYTQQARPLSGIRVLDLTRIIAGPVCGRALAAYGADVMLVNAPHLPNIETIAETSRGKLSVHADLNTADGRMALTNLLRSAQVFTQGYRPGALQALGFGPEEVARIRPGIVYVSLSAYGDSGPWASRRGFDSLVQTATGFNHAEAQAAGTDRPRPFPMQILDHASGYLMAYGAQVALMRQAIEGGSWHVRVSLAQTARWLRSLGRVNAGLQCAMPPIDGYTETEASGFGQLTAVRHAAQFSLTPAHWARPSVPPGTHPTVWPFH